MKEAFGAMPHSRIALETGMHSPWVRLDGSLDVLPRFAELTTLIIFIDGDYAQNVKSPHPSETRTDADFDTNHLSDYPLHVYGRTITNPVIPKLS
jgi:hypothetical protein